MATEVPTGLLDFLQRLDRLLEESVTLYVSGGAAVILGYDGGTDTKDFDIVVQEKDATITEIEKVAGKGSSLHDETHYYLDVVPPIYPLASGFKERSIPIEVPLTKLTLRVLEVHDLIVTKLLRLSEKDRTDFRTLVRDPRFNTKKLIDRFKNARENVKLYWPDKLEKADKNFNALLIELGEKAIDWSDDDPV